MADDDIIPPIDPTWALPDKPEPNRPVTAATFARLLAAARAGGMPAVYRTFAEGKTITQKTPQGGTYERPAKRSTLRELLARRPDLAKLLDEACQQRRDDLLANLEDEVEAIALGPGDRSVDYDKNGRVTRERYDRRNKLYAALKLLQAHDPERFSEKRRLDVSGKVEHDHQHRLADAREFRLNPDAILSLDHDEQAELFRLLEKVQRLTHEHTEQPEIVSNQQPRELPAAETPNHRAQ